MESPLPCACELHTLSKIMIVKLIYEISTNFMRSSYLFSLFLKLSCSLHAPTPVKMTVKRVSINFKYYLVLFGICFFQEGIYEVVGQERERYNLKCNTDLQLHSTLSCFFNKNIPFSCCNNILLSLEIKPHECKERYFSL